MGFAGRMTFVVAALALLGHNAQAISMQHSFQPPYHGNTVPFWKHGAGAYVNDSYVRLTPAKQSRTGYFWNTIKSKMSAWEVEFDFQIKGQKMLGGDGFAFWYTDSPEVLGTVYGSADYWNGLGIFFDTYDNNAAGQTPLITAIVNDGTMRFDAGSDGEDQALGKCSYKLRNLAAVSRAKIKYEGDTLSVSIAVDNDKDYEPCFRVSGVRLGTDKHFGLSAHTGDVADSHDIYQMSCTDLSGQDVDLDELRQDYQKYIGEQQDKHEKLGGSEFQHKAMNLLHQIQDSLIVLESNSEEAKMTMKSMDRDQRRKSAIQASSAGVSDQVLKSLDQQLDEVKKALEIQNSHPPVDRDFITRQLNSIKGEIVNIKGGGGGGGRGGSLALAGAGGDMEKRLNEIIQDQLQIKLALQRIERALGSGGGGGGGGSSSYSSYSSYSSSRGGTSWFMYLIYLVVFIALCGGGYAAYQMKMSRERRQFKLL